ncbi:MAG: hypothetical protein HY754_15775 [Nitrospirae bacterium]|nr:hypothetical protein [Nitrospirota bacterium]
MAKDTVMKARLYEIGHEIPEISDRLKECLRKMEATAVSCRWKEDLSMIYRLKSGLPDLKDEVSKAMDMHEKLLNLFKEQHELEKGGGE